MNKKVFFILYSLILLIPIDVYSQPLLKENKNQLPTIDETLKVKVTDIAVVGSDRKEIIMLAMFIKIGDTVTPSQIKEDLQRIFGLGYFADVRATKEPYKDGFRLLINVVENPNLKSVKVIGATIFNAEKLESQFGTQINKIINFNDIKETIETIKNFYSNLGYQAVSIQPNLNPDGELILNINEGVIEDIRLIGNLETKNNVIMREIRQKVGDIFNAEIIRDDLRRIYNTNFFESVDIKPSTGIKNPNHIILDIILKEKQTGNINLGAAYNTRDGIVGTFAITKDNFLGTGQRLGVDLQLGAGWLSQVSSGTNWLGKIDWYDPWFFPDIFQARTGFGFSLYRQRQGNFFQNVNQFNSIFETGSAFYNYILINDRTGASLNFSKAIWGDPLTSPWRTAITIRGEAISPTIPRVQDVQIKINGENKFFNDLKESNNQNDKNIANKIENEFEKYVQNSISKELTVSRTGTDNRLAIGVSLSYDTRDFVANPHNGWNNVISLEPSFGDINYWKIFTSFNRYIPMPIPFINNWTIAFGSRLGMLIGDPSKISIYERFFSGGFDTIRGWPENGYLSGENVFVGSTEIRFPIYNIVSGVLFFDFGNFWNQSWQVTDENVNDLKVNGKLLDPSLKNYFLRYGFGAGIRLDTPLGSIRMDYGIRDITRPFDLNKGANFHFNIGQKF